MNRRKWLQQLSLGLIGLAGAAKIWAFEKLELSSDQWRERLTPSQYRILRDEGTEPAGSSALNDEHRDGHYHCAGCDLALFSSAMKYESGTGWPSFFRPYRWASGDQDRLQVNLAAH